MNDPGIHVFYHDAMATEFQVRIAGEDKKYAEAAATAAESDALSTACMVLTDAEIAEILEPEPTWLAILDEPDGLRFKGSRPVPTRA